MKLNFDLNNSIEKQEIVLGRKNYDKFGSIVNFTDFVYDYNLMSANTVSFVVHKTLNNESERLWDEIREKRLIWVKEYDEWFEIQQNLNESEETTKEVTAISLCEAELGQINIDQTEINTENDIAREDYKNPTLFYKPSNIKESLLHRILKKAPHYSISHVDESLWNIQRTFSFSGGNSIYDTLMGEIAEEFGCLFLFDSKNRSISVYDLQTNCLGCGHRGNFLDKCPKCNSTNLDYGYGQDTSILIDTETLAENISLTGKHDDVKNYIKVSGGDDVINAAISACNPSGSQYIMHFTKNDIEDMSDELSSCLEKYLKEYDELTTPYQNVMSQIYDKIDEQLKLESVMMPDITQAETNASLELAKLTSSALSPIAVQDVSIVSVYTVNNAVLAMAKCIINSTVYKIEILENTSSLTNQLWKGKFRIENRSNEEDFAENTGYIELSVNDDYENYIKQKIQKTIDRNDVYLIDVFDKKTDLKVFTSELKKYCLNRLISFESAYQSIIDVMIEANVANQSTYGDIYNDLYLPYYNKLKAIQSEIKVRTSEIDVIKKDLDVLDASQYEITSHLNLENYLGEKLWKELCAFRREDSYENSNYISDGLDNKGILEKAQELLTKAKEELMTTSTTQWSLSTNMYNILTIPEFAGLVEMFEGGNWIRAKIDEKIYRLRIVHFRLQDDDMENLEVEFSDVTQTSLGMNDVTSLMEKVQSMTSGFDFVAHQAEQGQKGFTELNKIRNDGLNTALYNISNSINQEFIIDEHGVTGRMYDDFIGDYSSEQVKWCNNCLVYTDDYWETAKCALGKIEYYNPILKTTFSQYGLIADAVIAGILMGNDIVGGNIYSENYSSTTGTHFDLNTGDFSLGGGKITFDSERNTCNFTGKITFEEFDYSNEDVQQAFKDSLGVTSVEKDIENFNNSSILTPLEKKSMLEDWNVIQEEYKKNIALAKAFEVYEHKTTKAYINAYNTLSTQIAKCGLDDLTMSTSIDTQIYNDINNYHLANIDLAVLINEEAKALSEKALSDAKAYTNEEIETLSECVNKEITDLTDELETTETYIDGAFKDGIVDDIELAKINQLLKQLDLEKADVDKEYSSIYNNSFLSSATKTSLKTVYANYTTAHTSLVSAINTAITTLNSTATQTEKQNKVAATDTSFDTYKKAITNVHESLNSAVDEISTLKVSDLREDINQDIEDVNSLIGDTQEYVDGAFYDNVINQSEAKAIKQHINQLNVEKSDLDARYTSIYNNASISTSSKTALKSAKDNYNTAHTSLINLINTAVSVSQDSSKTQTQKDTAISNMNTGFNTYKSKLSTLSSAFESAIDSIGTNKIDAFVDGDYKTFVEDIQTQVDGKSETYYQATQPYGNHINVANNASYNKLVGDLWYDSNSTSKKTYVYTKTANGSNFNYQWKEMEVPTEIFDLADGKSQIFTSKPSNYKKNDLWLIGSDYTPSISGVKVGYVLVAKKNNTGYTESDWVLSIKYTDDSALTSFISDVYTTKINYLEEQEDKKAETWYQSTNPVGTSAWTANGKTNANHKGDVWYNTNDQNTYIYDGSTWKLTTTTPPDSIFDKIDGKAQIFTSTPTPPYNIGDLWVQGSDGDIYKCSVTRQSGSYTSSDWVKASKYTDDSTLNSWLTNTYTVDKNSLQSQIDGKIETFVQSTDPSKSWTTSVLKSKHDGDLWYDTSNQKSYIYNGSSWDELKTDVPDILYDSIDSKKQVFVSTPTVPYYKGDLWVQGTSGDILYCNVTRESGSYTSSDWSKASKYTDDTVANSALEMANNAVSDSILTPAEKRNLLTELNNISALYSKYSSICSNLSITYYDYSKNYTSLITACDKEFHLNSSTTTELSSLQVKKFKEYFSNYYTSEANIINAIQGKTNSNINTAQKAADEAKKSATEALDLLSAIASDNKVTPVEKIQLKDKYAEITSTYNKLLEKYNTDAYSHVQTFIYLKRSYADLSNLFNEILEDMESTYDFETSEDYSKEDYNELIGSYYEHYQSFINYITSEMETNIQKNKDLADEAKAYGAELAKCLGFSTEIASDYVISPYIGGGYLEISSDSNGSVVIDPNKITDSSYIFGVHDSSDNLVMGVDTSGNAVFSGKIISTSGSVGGWTIDSDKIYMSDTGISSNQGKFAFWAGETNGKNGTIESDAKFKVGHNGTLVASDVSISGIITATGGFIGGFTIGSNSIQNGTWGVDDSVLICTGTTSAKSIGGSGTINGWCFTAGSKFGVTKDGALYASDANIEGTFRTKHTDVDCVDISGNGVIISGSTGRITYLTEINMTDGSEGAALLARGKASCLYFGVMNDTTDVATPKIVINNGANIGDRTEDVFINGTTYFNKKAYVNGVIETPNQVISNSLELISAKPYIDFHFGSSTADYTSRIIEKVSGTISIIGNLDISGNITRGNVLMTTLDTQFIIQNKTSGGYIDLACGSAVRALNIAQNGYVAMHASSFVNQSSKRYKNHLGYMSDFEANKLMNLNVVNYDYINGEKGQYGLYAEDVETIIPTCVYKNTDGLADGIDYTKLIPYMIKKIQMQQKEINNLKNNNK